MKATMAHGVSWIFMNVMMRRVLTMVHALIAMSIPLSIPQFSRVTSVNAPWIILENNAKRK